MEPLNDYALLGGLIAAGFVLGAVPLLLSRIIGPQYRGAQTDDTYECGVDTVGSAWIRFGIAYYLFALIFVAFEVDVLYLFPVAVVYGEYVWRDLIEITIFLGILSLALAYAWRKGVFKWT